MICRLPVIWVRGDRTTGGVRNFADASVLGKKKKGALGAYIRCLDFLSFSV